MVSPIFGISKREIHSEEVAYDHSCGQVQPGDHFTKDLSKVTCARCIKKFAKEVTPVSVEALEAELHFFRSAFPRAAANYKKVAAQQSVHSDAGDSAASQTLSPQSGESTPEVVPAATQRR